MSQVVPDPSPQPVPASEEGFAPVAPGVELCYQTFGDPAGEPLLLVMGLGGPMNWWDTAICEDFARAGFHVVRYDNRDTGRSSRVDAAVGRTALVRGFLGRPTRAPYRMSDLATDAVGLMDHLGWDSAHTVGVSMGGMIVQTLAVEHRERVRSMVSVMSTLGRRSVGYQNPALLPQLLATRTAGREGYVATSQKMWKLIGSPDYPTTEQVLRERAEETFDRGVSASGVMRQMLAIVTQPDRTRALKQLDLPAAVMHGSKDKMVHVSGGRATAHAIPSAELLVVEGMGHDLPRALHPTLVDLVRRTADRAGQAQEA
ncbi:alpha/beta fold hydrolase [Nocardioides marmoraquaticus]